MIDTARGLRHLERMLQMRRFEEGVGLLAEARAFPGHFHLYIGQEATGSGVMEVLGPEDRIATTHRNHGHLIGRGSDPEGLFAEILGRATGVNGGRGGTIHLCDPDVGFIQTSGVVGSVVGLAVGAGHACKILGKGQIACALFGDGALEEGIPFEAMNLAALWKLPVVFVCENNSAEGWGVAKGGYSISNHAAGELRAIPAALGIPATRIGGSDPFAVEDAMREGAEHCRSGEGPVFIEALTVRWEGSKTLWPELATGITDIGMATGDAAPGDRHREWFERTDPVLALIRQLLQTEPGLKERIAALDAQILNAIEAARQQALAAPMPDIATVGDNLYASGAAA